MGKLENDLREQVKQSLEVPLYWRFPRSEARNFIDIYQRDSKMNLVLLELAKLDFNLLQSIYLKELKELAEWDLEAIKDLPEYMKVCYLAMYNHVNEMVQDALEDLGLDILPYVKDQWVSYVRSLHVEAGWFHGGYKPTLNEYFKNGWISIGIAVGLAYAFFGVMEEYSSKEILPLEFLENWSDSELFYWPSLLTRLWDDLKTSKLEMERGDTAKSIQCYMIQEGVCEEEARNYIKGLTNDSWKKLNKFIAQTCLPSGFADTALKMTRCVHRMYHYGDWFGIQSEANKDCVNSSLFNPI
ncbi:hypothetical protein COLO4_03709 [Corchorus olitorius]|uniref:Terpene synthase metal-binding domain-containing protein n=1 Tax=Corchorus olitorius TaxID=93759 RepID=A0A1R3KXH0_9ROSI|nr:hypothetical protein COLO4_03709 [Corchorus olitorius]